jgi:CRISPR-associated endonuclease/helicase Cas3
MTTNYKPFFRLLTGNDPLPFQDRFASTRYRHTVLSVPTGLGKTDTVLASWLYRIAHEPATTPRRLLWCLPGRALTEQVAEVARNRIKAAGLENDLPVLELMGGSEDNDCTLRPDRPAVCVGTQDILLSRALNRGYARRPFRWPLDFALLNNDALWVLDEVQLLNDGLATSTQLAAFREKFAAFGPNESVWISATLNRRWLETVDFRSAENEVGVIGIQEEDRKHPLVQQRIDATKQLSPAPLDCRTPTGAAAFLAANHRPGTLSLAVVNRVARAREIWNDLRKTHPDAILLHSRFRPADRDRAFQKLQKQEGIVVSTQVIEAGIDISARLLLTDASPYSSLLQRFGRVNRYGESEGEIFWVDRPLHGKQVQWSNLGELDSKQRQEVSDPYPALEVTDAITKISALKSAAPANLPPVESLPPWRYVLRRADLVDLFDTTPDLAGNEIDISRFVRQPNDTDVYVAWRNWPDAVRGDAPPPLDIQQKELCPVRIDECQAFARNHKAWVWDALDRTWPPVEKWYPGMTVLFPASAGGYTNDGGWNAASKAAVEQIETGSQSAEAYDDDRWSMVSYRQTLRDHTEDVVRHMNLLLAALNNVGCAGFTEQMLEAARLHDWGKAHPVMQETLHNHREPFNELLAKQRRADAARGHTRKYFRHELASALAMLAAGKADLSAYLVAAHHGRVRLSIRSMPGERNAGQRIARGIRENDSLLACDLGTGNLEPQMLSLACMEFGATDERSWSDRMTALRNSLGPFRLAYLELLLRSADEAASEEAGRNAQCA